MKRPYAMYLLSVLLTTGCTTFNDGFVATDPFFVDNGCGGCISEFIFTPLSGANQLEVREINLNNGQTGTAATFTTGTNPVIARAHPNQRLVYVANKGSNNISAFRFDPLARVVTPVNGSPFPSAANVSSLGIHPGGSFLFAAGDDGVRSYNIAADGSLTQIGNQTVPNLVTDAPSVFTLNGTRLNVPAQSFAESVILTYTVNTTAGNLSAPVVTTVPQSEVTTGLAVHPSGQRLYSVADTAGNLNGRFTEFQVNQTTGALNTLVSQTLNFDPTSIFISRGGGSIFIGTQQPNIITFQADNNGTAFNGTVRAIPVPTPQVALEPANLILFGVAPTLLTAFRPNADLSLTPLPNTTQTINGGGIPDFIQFSR